MSNCGTRAVSFVSTFNFRRTALLVAPLCAVMLSATISAPALAADIRVGIKAEPTIDPHFLYLAPNIAIARHMFDRLVGTDAAAKPLPELALSWKPVGENVWEFKLREGVRFHDGSPFTAEDVLFSFDRVRTLPNNPNPYTAGLRTVKDIEIVDPSTIRVHTDVPNPELPIQFRIISIVSRNAAQGAAPGDFMTGKATIGTGPFKFVRFIPGDRLLLKRNDDYWGEKPAWENVTFRVMTNNATRVAALMADDVDVIDFVPPPDASQLKANPQIEIFGRQSDRLMYLALNAIPDSMPWFTDKNGAPLNKNPFRDARVRMAIWKGIDRKALVERGLEGQGVPAGQLIVPGFGGYDPAVTAEPVDLAGAKALLTEAGYPDGFGITIHCPNGRYVNDAYICQVLGGMLSRLGLSVKVEALPPSIFFSKVRVPEVQFGLMLIGWGLGTGTASTMLNDVLRTYDKAAGTGANNRGASDPELDRLTDLASRNFNEAERLELMRQALAAGKKNAVAIPLYAEMTVLAARKGFWVEPRADQQTVIINAKPRP